jgi:hypothetical protein
MSAQNPDFSLDSKRRIARTVRRDEARPAVCTNVIRPAFPRGGTLPVGEFFGMMYGTVSQNEGGFMFTPIVSVPPGL